LVGWFFNGSEITLAMPDNSFINWLQQLVHDRVSDDLVLELAGEDRAVYRLILVDRVIEIPVWNWGLGDAVRDHAWFDAASEGWHSPLGEALPAPGIDSLNTPVVEKTPAGYFIHYDILGLAYWMLGRAEEVGRTDLDRHGRFPATSSHAYRNGYLGRPVVDEWFAILQQVASRLWKSGPMRKHRFKLQVSHDVDEPSRYAFRSVRQMGRAIVSDIVRRKNFRTAIGRSFSSINSRKRLHPCDPCNTFEWIMDVSEHHDLTSAFYFVCGRTDQLRDPLYEVDHPAIRHLIRSIHRRGHEIGLHPSYDTYRSAEALAREARRFFSVCLEEGITQEVWGGRMHFLRWETPATIYAWLGTGMTYDSTLGYADRPGFRCGTCFEYTAFDPVARRALNLRIRPLIAMECTIMASRYMGLAEPAAAYDAFIGLKNACRKVNGVFTLLWHNSQLTDESQREMYKAVVAN
jgi:hypothetical protein